MRKLALPPSRQQVGWVVVVILSVTLGAAWLWIGPTWGWKGFWIETAITVFCLATMPLLRRRKP